MRIDLPQCGFKNCKFQADGNCLQKSEYDRCEHKSAISTINSIIMACNLCCLCQNTACQNTGVFQSGTALDSAQDERGQSSERCKIPCVCLF